MGELMNGELILIT